MFFRTLVPLLLAVAAVSAYPFTLYSGADCTSVLGVVEEDITTDQCLILPKAVKSFEGGTGDDTKAFLLFDNLKNCDKFGNASYVVGSTSPCTNVANDKPVGALKFTKDVE